MMWTGETPSWRDVVGALREAAGAEESVRLGDGVTDAEMDGWGVPVPGPVREVCRRAGLLQVGDHDAFGAPHPAGSGRPGAGWRCGEPGSYRIVHTNAGAETYYVDVDRGTGAWGPVFGFREGHGAELVAPSYQHWLVGVAGVVRCAARYEEHFGDFATAFLNWFTGDFADAGEEFPEDAPEAVAAAREPGTVGVMTVAEALGSGDPVLVDAGSRLPERALLADLRSASGPVAVPFGRSPAWPGGTPVYQRFHGGLVLAAVAAD
ncbi:hypothetical protein ACIQUQ_20300 [Streptomyces sp. NPDC101118]|uniref:hypothetical protein n=1 Tax=Streptomyces sp. NPDC101118 TaxID=3366109 RepID=UPI00380B0E1C